MMQLKKIQMKAGEKRSKPPHKSEHVSSKDTKRDAAKKLVAPRLPTSLSYLAPHAADKRVTSKDGSDRARGR
jgi:hypothetical protein